MARSVSLRRSSTTFRYPRAYTRQLHMELLEDRLAPVNGQWMAVFNGLPAADNLLDQAQYGQNLLSAAGVSGEEVTVSAALDLSGALLLRTPLDATRLTLTAELQAVPGFVFVQDYTPPGPANPAALSGPHRGRSEAIFGPFDYNSYLAREARGEIPDQSGPAESDPAAVNALTNNNAGSSGTAFYTQSETSIVAFGNTVVVGFNDSGSNGTASNKFTGFARSTDGGATFTDGGTLPPNANGDAGDPVLARHDASGRLYYSTLQFSGSGINVFRSDDNGATWSAPAQGAPGKSGFQDKQWLAVDNFAGVGNGNVYLIVRDFGGGNGIYLFRSSDGGLTFGPTGGTLIASGGANNVQGAFVAVGPDHSVYAFYFDENTSPERIMMRRSTDLGVSFGAPVAVATLGTSAGFNGDLGLLGRNNGETFDRTVRSNTFPHAVVNPVSGHLYVTYADNPAGTDKADVYVRVSTDGGATWSAATRVNDDGTTNDQWQPTLAVTPDGTKLGIFFYSRQEDLTTADGDPVNNQFKYYGRIANIVGPTLTFAPSFAISEVASKPEVGRDSMVNSVYMGDYDQAVATPGAFHVVWSDSRSLLPGGAGRSDPNVYYKKIALGLTVASTTPAAGSILSAAPLDYVVTFSEPIDAGSVQASDFTVDGVVADGFTASATQVVFHFDAAPFSAQGLHTMAMAAGAVLRLSDDAPLAAFSGDIRLDATGLAVTGTSPAAGGVFTLPGPFTYVVNFNEPIDPASVGADDLTLSAGAVTGAVAIEAPDSPGVYRSARYTIGGITAEVLLSITVGAGKLADAFGNPNPAAFTATYGTDYGTVSYPTPLVAKEPLGSLVYDGTTGSVIAPAGDTDSFTLSVDAGQTITVLVQPPVRTLYGGIGNGASNAGYLVALDPATGQGVVVSNAVNPAGLSGLVFDPAAGAFFGSTIDGSGSRSNLVRIDPDSGAATAVGAVIDGATGLGMSIGDLALQPGTGVLYGIRSNADGASLGGRLYRIDKATGVATLVGNTAAGNGGGIAFAPDGTLYHANSQLARLDPDTAARTVIASLPSFFDGLAARADGTLFAAQGGSGTAIYAINPTTGTATLVGNSNLGSSSDIDFRSTVLQPVVELRDPSGTLIGTATAGTPGQTVLLQTVPATTGGTYTITAGGATGTMGSYTMQVVLNAALEAEANGGGSNGTRAAAQNLDPSFLNLGGSVGRAAVLGNLAATTDGDYYAVTLAAGDTVSVAVEGLTSNFLVFELRDGSGFVLASSIPTGSNADAVLSNFLVTTAGTYYVLVGGNPGNYSLVVTRNADFDTENNDSFAGAQYGGDAQGALGYLAAGAGLVQVSSFTTSGLGTVIGLGHDPATGNLFTYGQTAGQIAEFTPAGVEVLPRINRPGASTDSLDLDFFGEAVNLGGTTVPAGSLLAVNGLDSPDRVYALNKDTGAVLATLNVSGDFNSVGGTYHPGRDTLYLIDWSADLIREVSPTTGAVLATFPVAPTGSPAFDVFYGDLDVDSATGNLMLVSSSQARIRLLTPTGAFVRDMDVSALGVSNMSGVAVDDRNGDIWVSTTGGSVIRLANVSSDDWYSFAANAGDGLSILTATPASAAGEFVNTLNPKIELYNPSGALVASGTVLDGKNEQILHTAAATGLYRVRVVAEGGTTGEYFVAVGGATGTEQPAFRVTGTDPANGANLLTKPTHYVVTLNDAVLMSSVQTSDLKVDGISATLVKSVGGNTLQFTLPTAFGSGSVHTVTIDAGAILDVQGTPISAFSATFTLDTVGPRVAATSVAPGGVVAPGALSYQVTFDEPMKVANLTTDDFSLRGNLRNATYSAGSFSFNSAGTVLTINYANLPDDDYTLTLVAGANFGSNFTDAVGNALDGEFAGSFPSGNGTSGGNFVIGFNADLASEAYPAATTAEAPAGSLVYSSQALTRAVAVAGDTDGFTLNVDGGQTITVLVTPAAAGLRPTVAILDPSGAQVGAADAPTAGQKALLQTVGTGAGGTYTIRVGGAGGTTGLYTVQVTLNAALEGESHGGPANNTAAAAQNLEPSFTTLRTSQASASRSAVSGQFTGNDDFYSFGLAGGESVTLVMTLANAGTTLFGPRTDLTGYSRPVHVVPGDLNGDGRRDLVTPNNSTGTVGVRLNNGNGTFGALSLYSLSASGANTVALGDINGDGRLDIATPNVTSGTVSVLLGNGNGTFQTAATYSMGTQPYGIALGDLNGDGRADVVTANYSTNNLSVRLGQSNGTLGGVTNFGVGSGTQQPTIVALGDFNSDGRLDAVTGNWATSSVSVLLGNGSGGFGTPTVLANPGTSQIWNIHVADLNGDARLDVVNVNYSSSSATIRLGNGDGTFQSPVNIATGGSNPTDVSTGDVNGDGKTDLAISNYGNSTAAILLGNGNGTFGAPSTFATGLNPYAAQLADLTGDGAPDLATANYNGNSVSVFLNTATSVRLQLVDSGGNVLKTGEPAAGLGGVLTFVAPAAGTYYARVTGAGGADYKLVATRGAAFDTEANDSFAAAQPLGAAQGALGSTGGGSAAGTAIRVAVVGSTYATAVAGQLNNDTYFNFTAAAVSPAQVDTAAELSNYDVVVLGDYPTTITTAAASAIRTWVEAGLGGIVSTAWINYNMYFYSGAAVAAILDPIVPINLTPITSTYWSTSGATISVTNSAHPVTQGVINFSPGYGEAPPTPDAAATVLGTESSLGRPAVVVNQAGSGRTVYLTPAYGYDAAWTIGAADRLLEQAVAWTAPTRETADWYVINVTSTAHLLRLETGTPADGPGEFVNALNPKIELYNPSGTLVASGTALADGRNEYMQYMPLTTGLYRIRVVGEGTTNGEYFLGTNFLPAAQNDSASTGEDTAVAVDVLANDSDVDGTLNPATVTIVSGPANGNVNVSPAGVVAYTPNLNYSGTDSFTYTVRDNDGAVSDVATVSITVNAVNDAPVAGDDSAATDEDTPVHIGVLANDADVEGDALTPVVVSGPSHGTLTPNADGSFTYTPHLNYFGSDSFTYKANDGQADSNDATVSLTVNPVNDAPVAAADSVTTTEDAPVTVLAPGVLGNDTDAENNSLSAVLVSVPSHGTVTLNSDGSFTYTPATNYFGPDSFTYKANDGVLDSNVATVSITVNAVNDAPVVTSSSAGQGVQYSDPITPVEIKATDVDSNGPALMTSTSYTVNGGAASPGLPNGLSLVLTSTTAGGPFPGGPAGERSWTVSGIANVAPGVYAVTAVVSDGSAQTATTFTLTVTPEDTAATYTGAQFVSTSSETSSTATVLLAATIRDITAVLPGSDPYAGDILTATVTFVNRDTNTDIATVPLVLVNPADAKVATAVYNWAVNIGTADSATYTVGIRVNGYYTRNSAEDNVVVTVAKPLNSFISGGGHIVLTDSAGLNAGDDGSKMNFGFGVKFNQSGTNLQGRMNLLVRRTESDGVVHTYQVKANAINSLGIQPATTTNPAGATVTGRANITDVTDPLNPVPVEGNATIQMVMTDAGETGAPDTIGVIVWNKDGAMWFSSNWDGAQTVRQALNGGNLQVKAAALAAEGPSDAGPAGAPLTAEAARPLLARVFELWREAGASPEALAAVSAAEVVVADLVGGQLGAATPGTVWLDADGAGAGWFVDPTPWDDSEFSAPGDQGEHGRVDLLSVLAHEFGHLLGHDHNHEGVMSESLGAGVRVLPEDGHDHAAGEDQAAEEPLPWAEPLDGAAPTTDSSEVAATAEPGAPAAPSFLWLAPESATALAGDQTKGRAAERSDAEWAAEPTPFDREPDAGAVAETHPAARWEDAVAEPIWVWLDPELDPKEGEM